MEVLHINSYYLDSRLYQNLYDALASYGVESKTFFFADRNKDTSALPSSFYLSKSHASWTRLFFFPKHWPSYRDLKRDVDLKSYDLLHSHSLMSNGYIANRAHRDTGLPYITAVRSTDLYAFPKYMPFLNPLGGRILREAEKVIFLSKTHLEKGIEIYGRYLGEGELRAKAKVIPNGIDKYFFENLGQPKELGEDLKLIYIGKVDDPNKNVGHLMKILSAIREKGVDASLTLMGRLEDKEFLRVLEKKEYINYVPPADLSQVLKNLREADIFTMLSHRETFGLVYPEAMSQGLPVLYTKGQGFDTQFAEGEVGFHASDKVLEDALYKIEKIRADYGPMSARAIQASKDFDWMEIAKEYLEIYNKILD